MRAISPLAQESIPRAHGEFPGPTRCSSSSRFLSGLSQEAILASDPRRCGICSGVRRQADGLRSEA